MPRYKADIYSFFLLLILTIAFFWEPIVRDVTFYFRDLFHWCYPAKIFYVEELRSGRFPLWNPYQYLGTPYAANISMSVFYPLNILFFLLPFQVAFKYHIIIHYFLFASFNYLFLRGGLRLSSFASLLASLALAFSGYVVFLHSQSIFLQSAIWLPLILYLFIKSLENNTTFRWIVFTAAALSVQCLGGNPQDVFISFLFMLAIGLYKVFVRSKKGASVTVLCKVLGAVGALSFGLSAIQLLPAVELVSLTSRGAGLPIDQTTVYSFHPVRLLEFMMPFPFGTIIPDNTYYGQSLLNDGVNLPWTLSVYLGLFPLFFILISILRGKSIAYLFLFLAFFFLLVSLGKYSPVYFICYKAVPGFSLFRYPEKYLFAVTFSLAVLCGFGCDSFLRRSGFPLALSAKNRQTRKALLKARYCALERWVAFGILTISATYAVFLLFDSVLVTGSELLLKALNIQACPKQASCVLLESLAHFVSFAIPSLLLIHAYRKGFLRKLFFLILALGVLFFDLASANKGLVYYTPQSMYEVMPEIVPEIRKSAESTGVFRIYRTSMEYNDQYAKVDVHLNRYEKQRLWEKNTLKKNIGSVYHLPYCDGYETFELKDYVDFFHALKKYPDKLLSLLNVRYIIVPEKDIFFTHKDFYRPLFLSKTDRVKIIENRKCFERAFLVNDALFLKSKQEVLSKVCETNFDFAATVAIESETSDKPAAGLSELSHPPGNTVCNLVVHEPGYIRINAAVEHGAYLVISDTYYPGWKGYVDGKEEAVLRANYIMKALLIPKGNHTIELRYEPASFKVGIAVTALTVLLLAVVLLYRKKDPHGNN